MHANECLLHTRREEEEEGDATRRGFGARPFGNAKDAKEDVRESATPLPDGRGASPRPKEKAFKSNGCGGKLLCWDVE